MKTYLVALLLMCFPTVFSQKTMDTIASLKLKENRIISVVLPPSYEFNSSKKYPILVVLDGDYLVDPFHGVLSYGNYWDDLPEVIIVGINQYNDRNDDTYFDAETGFLAGKGAKFFEFIGLELLPYIQKKYRTSDFKMIAGHDVTAGFMNFYLYKDTPLFDGYISMGAELATDMELQIPDRFAAIKKPILYYQSTADGDLQSIQDRMQILDSLASTIKNPSLNYRFDKFKSTSHYSLVVQSIPNALYEFFNGYQPISISEFKEKIAPLPYGYVEYLTKKYDAIENLLQLKIPIRLTDFKAIEAAILKNKIYNEFDELSILARKNYPKSMLADYHLGLMFEKKGNYKNAAKYYQAAFQKEEIGQLTKDMMIEKADLMKRNAILKVNEPEEEVSEETPAQEPVQETPETKQPE